MNRFNSTKKWAAIIAVVCGAELVGAAVLGGAGLSAFFGLEGLAVAVVLVAVASATVLRRRSPNPAIVEPGSAARS